MSITEKKIYIIAGEASGDLHASNLMKALLDEDQYINFRYWGGDRMAAVKEGLVKHIRDLAFMGFIEVLMNIRTILGNIKFCKKDILEFKPDALVLVDYPGFNLRIAEWAKAQNIKVYYYISPQIWAWKQSRVHKIKAAVDHMFVILPFEEEFYAKFDYKVEYVGHPLLDEFAGFHFNEETRKEFLQEYELDQSPIIAVLPGSRKQEVATKLPIMLEALKNIGTHQVVVAAVNNLSMEFYKSLVPDSSVRFIRNRTYDLLEAAEIAVVTSGTATLETALMGVPEVVCYKSSKISYHIAKRLIKVKYISLVNLIMDRPVVKELIQDDCNPEAIHAEVMHLLGDDLYNSLMRDEFNSLRNLLGGGGASKKVAQSLLKTIR